MWEPGTKVKLMGSDEVGVVVCGWEDPHGGYDYYIAFFGDSFPKGSPDTKPYVLRYFETSLEIVNV